MPIHTGCLGVVDLLQIVLPDAMLWYVHSFQTATLSICYEELTGIGSPMAAEEFAIQVKGTEQRKQAGEI
jgi:hypothetical protein